jgi:hypothetical protein
VTENDQIDGVEIRCAVSAELVHNVVRAAHPGESEILVVVGATQLTAANLAECIPRRALGTALGSLFRGRAYRDRVWDAGIAVAPKLCVLAETHPVVFAQILAHEFGHATVVIRDPDLHTYCTFLHENIRGASHGRVTQSHELPHEAAFDAFGNHVAIQLFGLTRFREEMGHLAAQDRPDRERLIFDLHLPPRADLAGLRAEVRAFAAPYRAALERIWEDEVQRAAAAEDRSITQQASRPIHALWQEG